MKRWTIRGFFIALLLLCVGGWGWSYKHCCQANYVARDYWLGQCSRGKVYLNWWDNRTMSFASYKQGWSFAADSPKAGFDSLLVRDYGSRFHFGFYVGCTDDEWWVAIPFWFPTLISVGLLFLIWRKTRAKPKGFPVEMQTSQAK